MVSEQGAGSPTAHLLTSVHRAGAVMCAAIAVLAVLVTRAEAGEADWRAYLALAGACRGDDDPFAAPSVQRRAIRCLVNWARTQGALPRLAPSRALQRAAAMKGRHVAACGQLSHTPCDADATAAVRASGYRFSSFGENLFATRRPSTSARVVVATWLRSTAHREVLMHAGFRELGAARVDAPRLLGERSAIVWVTAFAAPG